jgi:hypothetical protein
MKKSLIIFLLFFSKIIIASPQAPDILIVKKDTIRIYRLPINYLPKTKKDLFYNNLNKQLGESRVTNLYRGYVGIWEIEDGKLYLKDLKYVNDPKSLLKSTFPKKYKNGKVLADWFSDYLVKPKGKLLKWDQIFSRTYKNEEILYFKKGHLIKKEFVENYIDLKNGISRLNKNVITNKIFESIKEMNWNKMSDCECDDEYYITIGKNGIINKVEFVTIMKNNWQNFWYAFSFRKCTHLIKRKLDDLQFDIIKWNGKPYEEKFRIEFFYDTKNKELKNWTE